MKINEYKPIRCDGFLALVKEDAVTYTGSLRDPESVANFIRENYTEGAVEESVYVIALDIKNTPKGVSRVSQGSINLSVISPKQIFKRLLLLDSAAFMLIHNHPSGDVTPSKTDDVVTQNLLKAGSLMELPLIDHIIVSDDSYYSYREGKPCLWEERSNA